MSSSSVSKVDKSKSTQSTSFGVSCGTKDLPDTFIGIPYAVRFPSSGKSGVAAVDTEMVTLYREGSTPHIESQQPGKFLFGVGMTRWRAEKSTDEMLRGSDQSIIEDQVAAAICDVVADVDSHGIIGEPCQVRVLTAPQYTELEKGGKYKGFKDR